MKKLFTENEIHIKFRKNTQGIMAAVIYTKKDFYHIVFNFVCNFWNMQIYYLLKIQLKFIW
jgi:hypothetical protein